MGKSYRKQFKVSYTDIDSFKRLKMSKLIDYCTAIYYEQGAKVGVDVAYMEKLGANWIVDEAACEFTRVPVYEEELVLTGETTEYNRFFVYRTFELVDKAQQVIAKVELAMSLLDFTTRKLAMVPDELGEAFGAVKTNHIKRFPKTDLSDLPQSPSLEVKASYSDLDYNGHVFNGNYYDWLANSMSLEFLKEHEVQKITLRFEEEIAYGEVIQQYVKQSDQQTVHVMKAGEKIKAVATIDWR